MPGKVESRFYVADDGLRLHYLDVAPERDLGLSSAVCLAGLTRSARDFLPLAVALASHQHRPRRVVAFDYRGRGRSDDDPDWRHYDLPTERADFLKGLSLCGIDRAHFIGTSRGGLHVMAMAPTHRTMIVSVVLNDIGPVVEREGLARIKGYVGRMNATPGDFDDAVKLLKLGAGIHFDGLTAAEWRHFATTTFGEDERALHLRYGPQLARALDGLDLAKPLPESWDLFDAFHGLPVLTVRGANSDLLSDATFAAMRARWTGCQGLIVQGQGHAPLLADAATISAIVQFLADAD